MLGNGRKFAVSLAPGAVVVLVLPANPKRRTLILGIASGGPTFITFGDPSISLAQADGIPLRPENSPQQFRREDIGPDIEQSLFAIGQAADVLRGIEYSDL